MELTNFCQSCGMPLDNAEILGTEKDGSRSQEYCKYCYQNGVFATADLTLEEMTSIVVSEMRKRNIDEKVISMAVNNLPQLKRWKTATVQSQV
jgi:hypothetical protein